MERKRAPAQKARKSSGSQLPPRLAKAKVTSSVLAVGAYQKKLLAFFAPLLLPKAFKALEGILEEGSTAPAHVQLNAVEKTANIYGILEPKSAVSIINNTSVDARQLNIEAGEGGASGVRGFAAIARMRAEERDKRNQLQASGQSIEATFIATPSGPARE